MTANGVDELLAGEQIAELDSQKVWKLHQPKPGYRNLRITLQSNGRITILGCGLLAAEDACTAGEYLIALAEGQKDFAKPPPFRRLRVSGKHWPEGVGILLPWEPHLHAKGRVRVWANGLPLTVNKARQIGAYLVSLGLQQMGATG